MFCRGQTVRICQQQQPTVQHGSRCGSTPHTHTQGHSSPAESGIMCFQQLSSRQRTFCSSKLCQRHTHGTCSSFLQMFLSTAAVAIPINIVACVCVCCMLSTLFLPFSPCCRCCCRHLMTDDQGKVCAVQNLDFFTGCCKEGELHACARYVCVCVCTCWYVLTSSSQSQNTHNSTAARGMAPAHNRQSPAAA